MADRYAYLSFVGLFLMVCWGVGEWAERRRIAAWWVAVPALAAVLALAAVTERQLSYWGDNITLWSHTLEVTSENFVAQDNLGGALLIAGKFDEAMPHFQIAAQINPRDPLANFNIAAHAQGKGNMREAVSLYQRVLSMTSDPRLLADTYSNLGAAELALGNYDAAGASYESALRLSAENAHAWTGLGLLAMKGGDFAGAADKFARAAQLDPSAVEYLLLGRALDRSGRAGEAQAARQAAWKISPDSNDSERQAERMLAE